MTMISLFADIVHGAGGGGRLLHPRISTKGPEVMLGVPEAPATTTDVVVLILVEEESRVVEVPVVAVPLVKESRL